MTAGRRPWGRGRLPTPDELGRAPELAILGALDAAIDLALVALVAAQPALGPTVDLRDADLTDAAAAADHVIARAQALAAAIAAYRALCRSECDTLAR
jgi:hypothetical protein